MKKNKKTYYIFHKVSSLFMILTLIWLTISTPFVVAFQEEMAKQGFSTSNSSPLSADEEDAANPFGNNTEEKPCSGNPAISLSEEYLHDNHKAEYLFSIISTYHKGENAVSYTAFHGELLVPPPNFS